MVASLSISSQIAVLSPVNGFVKLPKISIWPYLIILDGQKSTWWTNIWPCSLYIYMFKRLKYFKVCGSGLEASILDRNSCCSLKSEKSCINVKLIFEICIIFSGCNTLIKVCKILILVSMQNLDPLPIWAYTQFVPMSGPKNSK